MPRDLDALTLAHCGRIPKVLFVGPYPPPHGGISVHVARARAMLARAGVRCGVLNIEKGAPASEAYIRVNGALDFLKQLARHARNDWTFHVHTNGHNPKSWLVALAGGLAARLGAGGTLTLHSGLAPAYLESGGPWRRTVARLTCALYSRVVCVNEEIADSLLALGVSWRRLEISPAYLPPSHISSTLPPDIGAWLSTRHPVLSTILFYRPEYGFELVVEAVERLRRKHARLGCLVIGGTEGRREAEALVRRHGLEEWMRLCGDVDHSLCIALMSRSDVFVRATYSDGDSISVREAVALGVPVVASNVGARPPGVALFPAGDADALVERVEEVLGV